MVAAACKANGGHLAVEWPRSCRYWECTVVKRFIRHYDFEDSVLDGCMYGLKSHVNLRSDARSRSHGGFRLTFPTLRFYAATVRTNPTSTRVVEALTPRTLRATQTHLLCLFISVAPHTLALWVQGNAVQICCHFMIPT